MHHKAPPGGSAHCAPRSSAPRAVDGHSPRGLDGTATEVRCGAGPGTSLHIWSASGCLKPVHDAGGAARTLSGEEPPRARRRWWSACGRPQGRGQVGCPQSAPVGRHVTSNMILSLPVGWTARLQAERTVPRGAGSMPRNGSFKVRRWPEGDRTAGAMASIAPGAASPYPTGIPHPSEPPTSSQPERWRLPWRRRQCQPSTGIRGFGEVRGPIQPAHARSRSTRVTRFRCSGLLAWPWRSTSCRASSAPSRSFVSTAADRLCGVAAHALLHSLTARGRPDQTVNQSGCAV